MTPFNYKVLVNLAQCITKVWSEDGLREVKKIFLKACRSHGISEEVALAFYSKFDLSILLPLHIGGAGLSFAYGLLVRISNISSQQDDAMEVLNPSETTFSSPDLPDRDSSGVESPGTVYISSLVFFEHLWFYIIDLIFCKLGESPARSSLDDDLACILATVLTIKFFQEISANSFGYSIRRNPKGSRWYSYTRFVPEFIDAPHVIAFDKRCFFKLSLTDYLFVEGESSYISRCDDTRVYSYRYRGLVPFLNRHRGKGIVPLDFSATEDSFLENASFLSAQSTTFLEFSKGHVADIMEFYHNKFSLVCGFSILLRRRRGFFSSAQLSRIHRLGIGEEVYSVPRRFKWDGRGRRYHISKLSFTFNKFLRRFTHLYSERSGV